MTIRIVAGFFLVLILSQDACSFPPTGCEGLRAGQVKHLISPTTRDFHFTVTVSSTDGEAARSSARCLSSHFVANGGYVFISETTRTELWFQKKVRTVIELIFRYHHL